MTDEERIVAAVRAEVGDAPILLGGSRAAGGATSESDWDVAVVLPWPQAVRELRRLGRLARSLEQAVGSPVTISPLPTRALRSRRPRLFVWKLRREGRVLWPPGFVLEPAGAFELDQEARFSYAASAAVYLLAGERRKAGRHLVQLRQLAEGAYDPGAAYDGPDLAADVAAELRRAPAPGRGAVVRNLQYAVLSALRGRNRLRALTARRRLDAQLAAAP